MGFDGRQERRVTCDPYLENYLAHQRAALCRTLNDETLKIHRRLVIEDADIDALIAEQRDVCVREVDAQLKKTRDAVHGTRQA
jgi:hypothetical protein